MTEQGKSDQSGNPNAQRMAALKDLLTQAINRAREDVGKVEDPKAQALLETTAEVLTGLRKAYEDFEQRTETAWSATTSSH